jgi:hypothetical protein
MKHYILAHKLFMAYRDHPVATRTEFEALVKRTCYQPTEEAVNQAWTNILRYRSKRKEA